MHGYDIVMLAILFLATVFGAWKGMAWQIASLASIVVSGFVAVQYSPALAPMLSNQAPWNRFLAMLVLFLITSLAVWLIFRVVSRVIDRVRLKEFDRQAGALLGLLKGVLICVLITFFAVTLSPSAREMVLASRSGYYIAVLIERADPFLPSEAREVVGEHLEELRRRLNPEASPERFLDDRDVVVPGVEEQLRNGSSY